uniref:Uncharacterized protein n=1 Tax=Physcomitrium patens TaxID=3218 RepID=A0A2K1ISV2_PHYPA|nr:hypothetical protein PHYPA_026483 [Physcomitrium patens]
MRVGRSATVCRENRMRYAGIFIFELKSAVSVDTSCRAPWLMGDRREVSPN